MNVIPARSATFVPPQVGMPEPKALGRGSNSIVPRKVSGYSLELYLKSWAEHIRREELKNRKLLEMSVTIHRRDRALTLSDQCGRYGVRPNTVGRWMDYDPDLDGEIHPIDIVGPALATNTNACLQSNAEIEVASANQNAVNKQNAIRWQRVSDYFERTAWDEMERAFIFDAVQKDGTTWVYSYREKVDEQTIAEVRQRKLGLAVFKCDSCDAQGMTETEGVEEGKQSIPCPQCKQSATGLVKHFEGYDSEDSSVPVYRLKSKTYPLFNVTIDNYNAKVKGIQGAKWLQIQELMDRMELEDLYPGKIFGSPMSWTYALRCDYALAAGDWGYLNSVGYGSQSIDFQKFERRSIYLHESAYKNWVSPSDYSFTSAHGKTAFEIKRGQTIEEAFDAMYGLDPDGFKFVWMDERLIDIACPDEEEINFRECFSDVHWRRVSGSYLSSPHFSVVTIQDDITLLNTTNHNIAIRNAFNPVYFDSQVFEEADFSKEYIGSKNAHLLGEDRDLKNSVVQLPAATPSPYLGRQLEFLWSIKDTVTQVTPAMRGESQDGETLGAVRQQLEQSYGGLTSVLKSWSQCKVSVFKQKARMASKFWTLEQFQRVAAMFGETWSEEDIEEMCAVDFDEDLIVSYREGSEMPTSNSDREHRFAQGINTLMPFLAAGVQLPPDKFEKILQKIDEFAGFDFDLTGLEVDDLIAQKKYLELAALCDPYAEMSYAQVEAARTKIVALDGQSQQPISALDIEIEQIFARSDVRFSQYEDLDQQKAFFTEQLRREIGKAKGNFILIEMLNLVLHAIEQAQQQLMQQAMASAPPDPAAEAEKAKAEAALQAKQADLQAKGGEIANENQQREADRQTELANTHMKVAGDVAKHSMTVAADAASQVADQSHEAGTQAVDHAHDLKKQELKGKIDEAVAKHNAKKPAAKK